MGQFGSHLKLLGKMTLKNKSSLFWVFVYPLLLVTMMSIAFRGAGMKLQPIPVAAEQGFYYTVFLKNIDMLDLTVMDSHEAEKALREGKVAGYFRADGVLIIREDSSESRILGEIGDELKRAAAAGRQGINPDFSTQYVSIAEQEADLLFDILSMTVAMFTLYAYFSGIGMIDLLQANLSPSGRPPVHHAALPAVFSDSRHPDQHLSVFSGDDPCGPLSEIHLGNQLSVGPAKNPPPLSCCLFLWSCRRSFRGFVQ